MGGFRVANPSSPGTPDPLNPNYGDWNVFKRCQSQARFGYSCSVNCVGKAQAEGLARRKRAPRARRVEGPPTCKLLGTCVCNQHAPAHCRHVLRAKRPVPHLELHRQRPRHRGAQVSVGENSAHTPRLRVCFAWLLSLLAGCRLWNTPHPHPRVHTLYPAARTLGVAPCAT